ncbi:helix-turn-helix transcriptional regulator [Noviherbaspirillum sp. ST9]|uniref:helix-turn-helix transcriptional regulator n=1 Tax=Noviherbaspirillum sp. ST9 TaxID=3401606 RepID=UPI003B58832E
MASLLATPQIIGDATQSAPDYVISSYTGSVVGARFNFGPCIAHPRKTTEHVLSYHISGNTDVERLRAGRVTGSRSKVGSVTFIPANQECDWLLRGKTQVLHLYFPDSALGAFSADAHDAREPLGITDFFSVIDPWLDGFFRMLVTESASSSDSGTHMETLLVDQMQSLVIRHLVKNYSKKKSDPDLLAMRAVGRLRPSVLKKIEQMIHDRLADDICLKDLSDLACMSKSHFLSAFRETIGQTPYDYVLATRMERARSLLRDQPQLPIGDIARLTGFKNLAHFSTTFRRHTSLTPSAYRGQSVPLVGNVVDLAEPAAVIDATKNCL